MCQSLTRNINTSDAKSPLFFNDMSNYAPSLRSDTGWGYLLGSRNETLKVSNWNGREVRGH